MAEPTKELFKFAFFSKFEENISFLSKLADPENGISVQTKIILF